MRLIGVFVVFSNELARRVGLSPSPCLRRMRMLEKVALSRGMSLL
nr:winged helix-turn-helix domain-containing protein [Komagataeibacter oboediens]